MTKIRFIHNTRGKIQPMIVHDDRLFLLQTGTRSGNLRSLSLSQGALAVERALYGVILLVACLLRLIGLGARPLLPLEAANAWAAWLATRGPLPSSLFTGTATVEIAGTLTPSSALLYSLHSLLFWTLQGSDVLARWLPALAGTGLVLLPWALRRQLGRPTALALALLLAVDPWLVAISRVADGAMLSIALMLVILVAVLNLPGAQARRWSAIAAVAVGLLVVSGVQAWSLLPVVGLAFVVFRSGKWGVGERGSELEPRQSTNIPISQSPLRPISLSQLALFAAASALLGATAWLARPEGLGYVSASAGTWLSGLFRGDYGLSWLTLRLWVDQPLLLIFAPLGLIALWRAGNEVLPLPAPGPVEGPALSLVERPALSIVGRPALSIVEGWPRFVTLWLAWAIGLVLLPGRNPFTLALLSLPLTVLAAHALGWLIEQRRSVSLLTASTAALVAILGVLLVAHAIFATALVNSSALDGPLLGLVATLSALVIIAIAISGINAGWRSMLTVGGMFLATLLSVGALSSALWLTVDAEVDSPLKQPSGFFAQTTSAEVRQLAADVQRLSALRTGFDFLLPVQVQRAAQPDPLLGWYLRDMRNLTWTPAPTVESLAADTEGVAPPLVITRDAEPDAPRLPAGYAGSLYGRTVRWLPDSLLVDALVGNSMSDSIGEPVAASGAELSQASPTFSQRLSARWTEAWRPLLRWLRYGETQQSPAVETVVLWASVE